MTTAALCHCGPNLSPVLLLVSSGVWSDSQPIPFLCGCRLIAHYLLKDSDTTGTYLTALPKWCRLRESKHWYNHRYFFVKLSVYACVLRVSLWSTYVGFFVRSQSTRNASSTAAVWLVGKRFSHMASLSLFSHPFLSPFRISLSFILVHCSRAESSASRPHDSRSTNHI